MKTTILMATLLSTVVMTTANAQEGRERPDFATLDANGDGAVTLAEIEARGAARFAEMDTDGDGALSADELAAVSAEKAAERAGRMLERLDENGDGLLQQDELQSRGGDRAERMFERADADDDGAISAEEFDAVKERGGRHGRGGHGPRRGRG